MRTLAIGKALTLSATALALTLPTILSAQVKCPVVRSVISDDRNQMEGVGLSVNEDGFVDVRKGGVPGILRGADYCSLDAPNTGFDLDCTWKFSADDEGRAKRRFERLRKRLDECLPIALEPDQAVRLTDQRLEEMRKSYGSSFVESVRNNERLGDFSQKILLGNGDDVAISLDMTRDRESGRIRINVNIYRD